MRKSMNTIWEIQNVEGIKVKSFQEIFEVGTTHFQSLFMEPEGENIAEIIRISSYLPKFVEDNQNVHLMVPISKEELKEVVYSFQLKKKFGSRWLAYRILYVIL
jgi:hypothetical protein